MALHDKLCPRKSKACAQALLLLALLLVSVSSSSVMMSDFFSSSLPGRPETQVDYVSVTQNINITRIAEHVEFFESLGSRATGHPGNDIAAAYIRNAFSSYGLADVYYQNFSVTVPLDSGASITVLSPVTLSVKAHVLVPNLAAPVVTPPEGITGRLIYVGEGTYADFDGKKVEGSIVLMDFNSGCRWLIAANLGAKAVVFIEPRNTFTTEAEAKYLSVPFMFPRFYVTHDVAQTLLGLLGQGEVMVNVKAHQRWTEATGRNVIGIVRGSQYPDRIVIYSAYYDSYSVAPSVAPGAEEAVSVSYLLELARYFSENRPKHTIWLVAYGGHHQGLAGATKFVEEYVMNAKNWDSIGKNITLQINLGLTTATAAVGPCFTGGFWGIIKAGGTLDVPVLSFASKLYDMFVEIDRQLPRSHTIYRQGVLTQNQEWMQIEPETPLPSDHEPLLATAGPAISIVTAHRMRLRHQTPIDTSDRLNLNNLREQVEIVSPVLNHIANLDNLYDTVGMARGWVPQRYWEVSCHWTTLKGVVAAYNDTTGWYSPLPNALLFLRFSEGWSSELLAGGGIPWVVHRTDDKGEFSIPGIIYSAIYRRYFWRAYVIDEATGQVVYGPDHGPRMFATPQFQATKQPVAEMGYVVLHKCGTLALFNVVDPNLMEIPRDGILTFSVLDALTNTPLEHFGVEVTQPVRSKNGYSVAMVYVPSNLPTKLLVHAPYAIRFPLMVFTNASERQPEGEGFKLPPGAQLSIIPSELLSLRDTFLLDSYRLTKVNQTGVLISSAASIHRVTQDKLGEIYRNLQNNQYSLAFGKTVELLAAERAAYIDVRYTVEDTINVIPFFSFLLIPFAFFAERLIIHSSGRRRIIAVILMAAPPLAMLSFYHPGFILAADPSTILISFAILILIAPVFGITFGNVQEIIRKSRKARIGTHVRERRFGDTLTATFSVAVENLRRRVFRTSLTTFSIILMITSVTAFTSLSGFGYTKAFANPQAKVRYDGIMVRHYDWARLTVPLGETFMQSLMRFQDYATIAPRAWLWSQYRAYTPIWGIFNGVSYPFMGALGLSPNDPVGVNGTIIKGRFFVPGDKYVCLITDRVAERFNVTVGDKVSLLGLDLEIKGIVDQNLFNPIVDLDQEAITPLDPTVPDVWNLHYTVERSIIIPYKTALELGGWTISVSMTIRDATVAPQIAESIFKQSSLPVYFSVNKNLYAYSAGVSYTVLGLEFQLVPLALAILVLLNVMLGAVYERMREISIYCSVGLSPLQVSLIFIYESMIYALVGSLIGYILAMGIISSHALPVEFSLNYASSRVLISFLLGIGVTVASSLYPAYKAARLVTPSLERIWKIPTKPSGNEWSVPLPFSTGDLNEARGLLTFLQEFAESHRGERMASFSVSDIAYDSVTQPNESRHTLTVHMKVEPYELDISQSFQSIATNREPDPKYYFEVLITRLSGPEDVWRTMNREVLNLFRTQFLIWRGMNPDAREAYVNRAEESLEKIQRRQS